MRYVAVQNDAGYERTDNAFQPHRLACCRTHKEHRHNEDELHDGVAITSEKAASEARYEQEHGYAVAHELAHEEQPEPHARLASIRGDDGGERHECHE